MNDLPSDEYYMKMAKGVHCYWEEISVLKYGGAFLLHKYIANSHALVERGY